MSGPDTGSLTSMSSTVTIYDRRMGRWEPNARGRLQGAALELEAGIVVVKVAFERWIKDTRQDLPQLIGDSLDDLKAVTAGR
jgi:hypothetical protein